MHPITDRLKIVEQLKPFLNDEEYGRVYADLHDLMEASEWFLSAMNNHKNKTLNNDQIEDFLIELDVRFIQHVSFHLTTLRKDVESLLSKLATDISE